MDVHKYINLCLQNPHLIIHTGENMTFWQVNTRYDEADAGDEEISYLISLRLGSNISPRVSVRFTED